MRTTSIFSIALTLGLAAANPLEKRATTTTSSTSATSPVIVQTAGSFVYALCAVEPFYNGIEARTLHGSSSISTTMTVEQCASYCSGYSYFGVEFADECYCGNKLHNGTTQDVSNGCSQSCAGNSSEFCGGSGRMNFYQASTISSTLSLPTSYSVATQTSVNVAGWVYIACISDPAQYSLGRALTGAGTSSSSMTVEYCASFCSGYQYFGVEYSQECFCGNTLSSNVQSDTTACGCNLGCSGADQEACGGSWRLNLYEASGSPSPTIAAGTGTCTSPSASNTGTTSSSSSSTGKPTTVTSATTSTTSTSTSSSSSTSSKSTSSTVSSTTSSTTSSSTTSTTSSSTSTTTSKATSTSTSTSVSSSSVSTCSPPATTAISSCSSVTAVANSDGTVYYNYYSGSGKRQAAVNPGDSGSNSATTYSMSATAASYPSSCGALGACAEYAEYLSPDYLSFQLVFRNDTCAWNCTIYAGAQYTTGAAYFNVVDTGVLLGYGYSTK